MCRIEGTGTPAAIVASLTTIYYLLPPTDQVMRAGVSTASTFVGGTGYI